MLLLVSAPCSWLCVIFVLKLSSQHRTSAVCFSIYPVKEWNDMWRYCYKRSALFASCDSGSSGMCNWSTSLKNTVCGQASVIFWCVQFNHCRTSDVSICHNPKIPTFSACRPPQHRITLCIQTHRKYLWRLAWQNQQHWMSSVFTAVLWNDYEPSFISIWRLWSHITW
jgi:hypothetical protein